MRNLRNIHRSVVSSRVGTEITASTWDVVNDSVICVFGPTKANSLLELQRWHHHDGISQSIASWDVEVSPLPDLECDEVIDVHHFSDNSVTCLIFAGGDLVLVREELRDGEEKIEIVGTVDAGIRAAAWSPDEELLAIITRADTLLYMTKDLENVTDIALTTDDLKISQHVSVGWGKKETQFKGKSARVLRDPTMPETVDEGSLSTFDAGIASVSWRGDGSYLAINSGIEHAGVKRRVIRVYSRDGMLDSVSEPVNCQESALSWRPAGNLIASVQRLEDRLSVIFFERNGLRHGSFDLRLSKEEMVSWGAYVSLKWNVDSSVLAVLFVDRVQLWTMGNYHYYLKQEIFCSPSVFPSHTLSLMWHTERPLHLILHNRDHVQRLAYASSISNHPASPPNDYGTLAVIDGTNLQLTPMRLANVPPPMALHCLSLPKNVIDVAILFVDSPTPSFMIGVLDHEGVSVFAWPVSSMLGEKPKLQQRVLVPSSDTAELKDSRTNLQISVVDQSSFGVLQHCTPHFRVHVIAAIASHDGKAQGMFQTTEAVNIIVQSGPNVSHGLWLLSSHVSQEASKGHRRTHMIDISTETGAVPLDVTIVRTSSPRVDAVSWNYRLSSTDSTLPDGLNADRPHTVFSLTENHSLFANDRCLVKGCTSFIVSSTHLIYTTSQHLLKFVHLSKDFQDLDVPPDTPESDERCRSIERGARLVTVMPTIFALVLQMPRGNLETIFPRALVLAGIRDSVIKRKYKRAFLACRSHRVDMNILHDYAPTQFLENTPLFIKQLKKPEFIDLFLSQLRNEDVSKTMYRETLGNITRSEEPGNAPGISCSQRVGESKVNRICNSFLNALGDYPDHVQNIISAHVCKQPPDMEAGLSQIARMRNQNSDHSDLAIEHICFLTDINRLYDSALGLYNLEMTILIAQQSQKDPREYIPFLQKLQAMPTTERKFSIDDHLRRYAKALNSLCEMDSFDEVKRYVMKHQLYAEALEYYRYQETKLNELMRLHAEYLQACGNLKDAALTYDYLNDYVTAASLYRQAHSWKESLSCANLVPMAEDELRTLAASLAASSAESRDYASAASIHYEYLADISTAASLFCKGYYFADALRIVALHRRQDLLEQVIDPGLTEGLSTMTELIAECKAQVNAQVPRIRELRAKKAENPVAFFDGEGAAGDGDIPDDVSIAPTDASTAGGNTLFTRYTNRSSGTLATNATRRSSKNRRREERKRARGKKGSVYEKEYLVASVRRLIEKINAVGEEVERLAVGLMRRGMRERARAIESSFIEVVDLCRACLGEVFGSDDTLVRNAGEGNHGERGDGKEMLGDLFESGTKTEPPPLIKDFARLSLLGH